MEAEFFSSAKVVLIRTLFLTTQNYVIIIESCSRDLTQLLSLLFNIKFKKKKRESVKEMWWCSQLQDSGNRVFRRCNFKMCLYELFVYISLIKKTHCFVFACRNLISIWTRLAFYFVLKILVLTLHKLSIKWSFCVHNLSGLWAVGALSDTALSL